MSLKKIIQEKCKDCDHNHCKPMRYQSNSSGGAAFYFIPQAVGGEQFVMAILKSLAWPAILVYQALSLLKL